MSEIKQNTADALERFRKFIEDSPWSERYLRSVCEIQRNFDDPCVLAVAGRVKVGKSSFVNAFLKQDLALVGVTETTATINYFRYGKAPNEETPIRCVWDDGSSTWESVDFLNSLQGTSLEALERSVSIKRLEFYVDNPNLEHILLVDTPGIGAVTENDAHEVRTSEFFQIRNTLRERHSDETEGLAANADALIYLTDHVIQQCDADFLVAFQKNMRSGSSEGTSINMLVVMGQADMNKELLQTPERATNYVQYESRQLNQQLETPVPLLAVSAGIQRALDRLGVEGLGALRTTLRRYFSKEDFDIALESEEIFLDLDVAPDFQLEERYKTLKGFPWMAFRIVAEKLYYADSVDSAMKTLKQCSGFETVRDVLDRHFFQRAELLRCFTIVSKILNLLYILMNDELAKYKSDLEEQRKDIDEFALYILSHPDFKTNPAGKKLQKFIKERLPVDSFPDLSQNLQKIYGEFTTLKENLNFVKDNYEGLQLIETNSDCLSDGEKEELYELFGLYPTRDEASKDCTYCGLRSIYWRNMKEICNSSVRRRIASLAEKQYQRIICYLQGEMESK